MSEKIRARWEEFHRDNPKVYQLFKRFAFELLMAGQTKLGARMIWERMRWESKISTTESAFNLNDHYPPYYARLFMADHPQHDGVFETRAPNWTEGNSQAEPVPACEADPGYIDEPEEPDFEFDEDGQGALFGTSEPETWEGEH